MGLLSKAVLIANPESAETLPTRDMIKHRISEFHARHAVFQGMVLQLPCDSVGNAVRQQLATMVSSLGMAIDLGGERVLALFPREIDCKLMSHRLTKSLGAVSSRSFEADSPEHALALLEPLIR
jgi:hypothetical protein